MSQHQGEGHRPQFQVPKLSKEDQEIYAQCRNESFYYRCLPLAALFSGGVVYAMNAGIMKPSPRFGVVPKVLAASIMGYIAGKVSYSKKCADKFIQSPSSEIGAVLRRNKGIKGVDGVFDAQDTMGYVPDSGAMKQSDKVLSYESSSSFPDTYIPSLDLDTAVSSDVVQQPSEPQHFVTYDELRQRNRDEYEEKRKRPAFPDSSQTPVQRAPPVVRPAVETLAPKNKYGDTWES